MDTFQGRDAGRSSRLLAVVPEEPAVRVLAVDFTQKGNDEGEVLLDPRQSFPSRYLIECVLCNHDEVIAIGIELQRLPCEVYTLYYIYYYLLGSTLRAPVLEAFEVKIVEGVA